jgi:hypothetical protein
MNQKGDIRLISDINMKILRIFFAIAGFLSLGLDVYLQYHYMLTMPKTPHPELNLVYPLNVHGSIVYLTRNQHLFIDILFWVVGFLVFFNIILAARAKEKL